MRILVENPESGSCAVKEHLFVLGMPNILGIFCDRDLVVGTPFRVRVQVTNPLSSTLTNCRVTVEGQNMTDDCKAIAKIPSKGRAEVSCQLTARKPGTKMLLVDLDSDEIQDIKGF